MKQHITREQFSELSDAQKDEISHWVNTHPNGCSAVHIYDYDEDDVLLTIGQMIEFLLDNSEFFDSDCTIGTNFCNDLWEAVKEVLTNKDPEC